MSASVQEKFKRELEQIEFPPSGKLLLAVSGGVDSMVLWDLIHKLNHSYAVAHMNFSLRAEESLGDMQLVEQKAKTLGVHYHLKTVDCQAYAKRHKLSIQMAARQLRYQWFKELMTQNGYACLLTAHHLDDAVETFLINLNRGTGLGGLIGIPSGGDLIRPLLAFSKTEIKEYAKINQLAYREDRSNAETTYLRNWFRHQILSPWKEENPEFLNRMKNTFDHLKEAEGFLRSELMALCRKYEEQLEEGFFEFQEILQHPHPKMLLQHLLLSKSFSWDTIDQLFQAMQDKKVGKRFDSPEGELLLDREKVFWLEGEPKKIPTDFSGLEIQEEDDVIEHPIRLEIVKRSDASLSLSKPRSVVVLDREKLKFPLLLRKWKAGDRFIPLGMKGSKKVSDLLIDEKLPLHEKENIFVLVSDAKIAWVIGIRIDDRFKVSKQSKQAIEFRWMKS